MIRTELNIGTGEVLLIPTAAYVVNGTVVLIDEGLPVPAGALAPPQQSAAPVPKVVTKRQGMLALLAAGLLEQVEQIIAQSPRAVQITWDAAQDFDRNNPLIEAIAYQIGLTESDIDNLFIEAAKL